jgi:DNA invertase Pin-like site-specific DNA recombinase
VRVDGYIRVSQVRGREGESFISPDVQREQIQRWADGKGWEVVAWHSDLDQPGTRRDRPGLVEALRRAEADETDAIAVAKLDRFGRSLLGALDAIRQLDDAGARFVSVAEGIDPTTPAGKMMLRLLLVLAEFEVDRVRENWAVAQERAVARGVHIASKTPTGYVRGDNGRLEPHPEFGPAITELFRRRAAGASWRELARFLDERGVVGPYGATNWRTRAVTHLIENRAYLGEARSGRHTNPDAHDPLTDRATFDAAQGARSAPAARSKEPALLAGLLRCAGCRHVLKPDRMTLRDGARARIYRCRGEHSTGTCGDRVAVLGRVVEPFVVARFRDAVGELRAAGAADAERVGRTREAVELAEAELVAYRDDSRIADVLGRERFVRGLEVRAERLKEAQRDHSQANAEAGAVAAIDVTTLDEMWPELEVSERQRLLTSAIDAVFLRSGRVRIEERALVLLRGEAPDDLPRRGRREPLRPFAWPDDPPAHVGAAAA